MRVAITSTVIVDVLDEGRTVREIRDRFYDAQHDVIGRPLETANGQYYVLRSIESLEITAWRPTPVGEET
jgi:hypothetical protein